MILLEREMGYTKAEFYRVLSAALHGYEYRLDEHNGQVQVHIGHEPLIITLGEEQQRKIALLAIPYVPVRFESDSVSEVDFQVFLKQFDLYYQKGGG